MPSPRWSKVRLILTRELRDQLRDRRTMFMVAVLPLLLYPLLGMGFFQIAQFLKHHASGILVVVEGTLPTEPPLVVERQFASLPIEQRDFLRAELQRADLPSAEAGKFQAEALIEKGAWDAVVVFPAATCEQLRTYLRREPAESGIDAVVCAPPTIYFAGAKERSRMAAQRLQAALAAWNDDLWRRRHNAQLDSRSSSAMDRPFEFVREDLSGSESRRAAFWSRILPLVAFVWALTGAFYPAIDLCAGEKERGTLETLLCSAAERFDIVWGKMLTVLTFSLVTSLLNLGCVLVTGGLVFHQFAGAAGMDGMGIAGPPPLAALGWLTLLLFPIATLFSCLAIALSTLARSTREGQYYLMPLLLTFMPLMMFALLPSAELDWGTSLLPVAGVMLFLRQVMEGEVAHAWPFLFPVLATTAACCWIALRWAVDQFSNETILFRSSDRFSPRLWVQGMIRDRAPTPSVAEALVCGLLVLLIRFFAGLSLPFPRDWSQFSLQTVVSLVAFVATPALLMAVMLTTRPTQTLLFRWTGWTPLGAACGLAICLHPLATGLGLLVRHLYPLREGSLAPVEDLMRSAPGIWQLVLLMAVLPAICEELVFRGFILSGLRHLGKPWRAIVLSSLFFGVTHGIVQQSLMATIFGLVLGFVAIRSQSILPCMVFHATHNALGILAGEWLPRLAEQDSRWLVLGYGVSSGGEALFMYGPLFLIPGCYLAWRLLRWFASQSYALTMEERRQTAIAHLRVTDSVVGASVAPASPWNLV